MPDEIVRLDRQMTSLRRGIGRLIDSYAEGIIDKTEFHTTGVARPQARN
jgi:site-specific DNA recombinase